MSKQDTQSWIARTCLPVDTLTIYHVTLLDRAPFAKPLGNIVLSQDFGMDGDVVRMYHAQLPKDRSSLFNVLKRLSAEAIPIKQFLQAVCVFNPSLASDILHAFKAQIVTCEDTVTMVNLTQDELHKILEFNIPASRVMTPEECLKVPTMPSALKALYNVLSYNGSSPRKTMLVSDLLYRLVDAETPRIAAECIAVFLPFRSAFRSIRDRGAKLLQPHVEASAKAVWDVHLTYETDGAMRAYCAIHRAHFTTNASFSYRCTSMLNAGFTVKRFVKAVELWNAKAAQNIVSSLNLKGLNPAPLGFPAVIGGFQPAVEHNKPTGKLSHDAPQEDWRRKCMQLETMDGRREEEYLRMREKLNDMTQLYNSESAAVSEWKRQYETLTRDHKAAQEAISKLEADLTKRMREHEQAMQASADSIMKIDRMAREATHDLQVERERSGELQRTLEVTQALSNRIERELAQARSSYNTMFREWQAKFAQAQQQERRVRGNAGALHRILLADLSGNEVIGQGSYGKVKRMRWLGSDVAVKFIELPVNDNTAKSEAEKEAALLVQLRHPCIADFYGILESDKQYGIVMGYCDRGTLTNYLKEAGKLDDQRQLDIARDITAGVWYLHAHNVVHRDIKSSNVMLAGKRCKIIDFGLSRMRDHLNTVGATNTKTSGNIIGTTLWMAPEIMMHSDVDAPVPYNKAADMYAVGIVLWEVTAQQLPYRAAKGNLGVIAAHKVNNKFDEIPGDTPAALLTVIEHLRLSPEERFSAEQAHRVLVQ